MKRLVQEEQFKTYTKLLIEWNKKFNLTAITDPLEIELKHFQDSLAVADYINPKGKIIDIGTGAGFPGIPLKIVYPELELTLLDSTRKKVVFLNEVINTLGLDKTVALHGRAEELAHQNSFREQYDFALSRAVANLRVLSELCIPFVKIGGSFIALKGPAVFDEFKEAETSILALGANLTKISPVELPDGAGEHFVAVIDKKQKTPATYPRLMSKILKSPI